MKTILLFVMVLASTFGAAAQGTIDFFNTVSSTKISTNSDTGGVATGLTGSGANSYFYALFYSKTATSVQGYTNAQSPDAAGNMVYVFNDPNWTFALYATNSPSAGILAASAVPNSDGSVTVPGVAAGVSARFVVLGWSANLGSTLAGMEFALSGPPGWVGESAVLSPGPLGDSLLNLVPHLFAAGSGFTLGFNFIPEPSTIALAGIGVVGLFFFRRQWNS